jgi:diacylglycerol kinase family enzyme
MRRAFILLNLSARRVTDATIRQLRELACARRLDAVVEPVGGASLAASARRAVESGCTVLVAAGGDGTVNAVADVAATHNVALGVLPLGTLNHFARDAGIPNDLEAAVTTLACGRDAAIDLGEVNGRIFLNNSSIGVYPRLLWEREQNERQGRRKWTATAVAALDVWRQYRRISVTIQGRGDRWNVCTPFVFVGNNEYSIDHGRIDARPSLAAGRLQLCVAPDADRGRMARIVLSAIAGRLGAVDGFEAVTASELSIATRARRLGVSLDGELTILESPLCYRIRPRALQVIVPSESPVA